MRGLSTTLITVVIAFNVIQDIVGNNTTVKHFINSIYELDIAKHVHFQCDYNKNPRNCQDGQKTFLNGNNINLQDNNGGIVWTYNNLHTDTGIIETYDVQKKFTGNNTVSIQDCKPYIAVLSSWIYHLNLSNTILVKTIKLIKL